MVMVNRLDGERSSIRSNSLSSIFPDVLWGNGAQWLIAEESDQIAHVITPHAITFQFLNFIQSKISMLTSKSKRERLVSIGLLVFLAAGCAGGGTGITMPKLLEGASGGPCATKTFNTSGLCAHGDRY